MRISFLKETVKQLRLGLHKAYEMGNLKIVRRISVLLMVANRSRMDEFILVWKVTRQTIIHWVYELMCEGLDSLKYEKPKGKPARLTQAQKKELCDLIKSDQKRVAIIRVAGQVCLLQK